VKYMRIESLQTLIVVVQRCFAQAAGMGWSDISDIAARMSVRQEQSEEPGGDAASMRRAAGRAVIGKGVASC